MFAMNATLKPRTMAAYTGSSSNTSRERVFRVSSIGRLSDDPSSRPCERRCKTSIDILTSEEQERERRGLGVHGSKDVESDVTKASRNTRDTHGGRWRCSRRSLLGLSKHFVRGRAQLSASLLYLDPEPPVRLKPDVRSMTSFRQWSLAHP